MSFSQTYLVNREQLPTEKVTTSHNEKVQLEFYGRRGKLCCVKHQTTPNDVVERISLSLQLSIQLLSKRYSPLPWEKVSSSLRDFQMLLQQSVAPVGK